MLAFLKRFLLEYVPFSALSFAGRGTVVLIDLISLFDLPLCRTLHQALSSIEHRVHLVDESYDFDAPLGANFEPLAQILETAFHDTYVRRFPVEPLGPYNPYK